ncbi:MAG TPA: hypothetical protein VGG45_06485 [Terracidiphilus sp.]|jgi:hypothetical protein
MSDDPRRGVEPQDSTDDQSTHEPGDESADQPNSGPSLVLLYSLIALALVAAVGLAALIVRPFLLHR